MFRALTYYQLFGGKKKGSELLVLLPKSLYVS